MHPKSEIRNLSSFVKIIQMSYHKILCKDQKLVTLLQGWKRFVMKGDGWIYNVQVSSNKRKRMVPVCINKLSWSETVRSDFNTLCLTASFWPLTYMNIFCLILFTSSTINQCDTETTRHRFHKKKTTFHFFCHKTDATYTIFLFFLIYFTLVHFLHF